MGSDSLIPVRAPNRHLQEVARMFDSDGTFTGGPIEDFEVAGRLQLAALLREGIYPESKLLDLGCGCLRGGYWLIHFLDPGCYFGIEPATERLQHGIDHVLEAEVLKEKRPRFDTNDGFDMSVFGVKFDIVLARSIWTHASKRQITVMLDAFSASSSPDAIFLTSYLPAGFWKNRDYRGDSWQGRSHRSDTPAAVHHSFGWIKEQVEARRMFVRQLPDLVFNGQYWLKIGRSQDAVNSGYRFQANG